MATLSLCMIVKNEEKNLPTALGNISKICDEIIIVDTGSTDRTIEVARSYGATILEMEWEDDFAKARNLSIRDAKSDWILWLDGDDFVPEDALPHIKELVESTPDCVYSFNVKNERRDGTGTEFLQARLFPNHQGLLFERPVHEQIMLSALRKGLSMKPSNAWLEHLGYADDAEVKEKAKRNVSILESNLEVYGDDPVTFVEIGDSYSILEDRDTADIWYNRTVTLQNAESHFPEVTSQAWMGLGTSANIRKEYDKAEFYFSKVVELCPGRVDLFYNLAVTYERLEQYDRAVSTLEKIFTTSPKQVTVGVDVRQAKIRGAMKMIRLLMRWGNEPLLLEKIVSVMEELNDRLEVVNVCAAAYYKLGEYSLAINMFQKSITERPDGNIDALIGLTMVYLTAERDELAIKQVEEGTEHFRDNCRYQLFRTLFSNDNSALSQFTQDKIESEITYLDDLFGLSFDHAIVKFGKQDEA